MNFFLKLILSYFFRCYEIKNVFLLKLYVKYKDNEFSLYLWDDKVMDVFKVFLDGIYSVI